ncbi:MAG: hypothetical protein NVS3B20_13800 [Polyangiales bacterium]
MRPISFLPMHFREGDAPLEAALDAFIAAARAEHPSVSLDPATFVAFISARWVLGEAPSLQLSYMRPGDLLLACACSQSDPRAILIFETRYLPALESVYRSFRYLTQTTDDIRQMLRERLLVGSADDPPKISLYRGDGDLGAWSRVVLTRLLINLSKKRESREAPGDDDVFSALTDDTRSPELELVKQSCAVQLRESFVDALQQLSTRQRNLLRYHFVEGLTAPEIASIYRVHRSSVMRWLADTKSALEAEMRASFARRVKLSDPDFDSLVRAAWSGFDVTLSRYLAKAG